jgi:hypothetical protein
MTQEQRIKTIQNIMEATNEALKNATTDEEKINIMIAQNMQIASLV